MSRGVSVQGRIVLASLVVLFCSLVSVTILLLPKVSSYYMIYWDEILLAQAFVLMFAGFFLGLIRTGRGSPRGSLNLMFWFMVGAAVFLFLIAAVQFLTPYAQSITFRRADGAITYLDQQVAGLLALSGCVVVLMAAVVVRATAYRSAETLRSQLGRTA